MDALALTAEALQEPWRLWTGHLAHFGWEHALANAIALAVPWILAERGDRRRLALSMVLIPPLLSFLLLPSLAGAGYRGASGLACSLWALVGLRLAGRRGSASTGRWMLGGLAFKLGFEAVFGSFLLHPEGWRTLPAAHLWGTLLGLAFALPPAWIQAGAGDRGPGRS